MTIEHFKTDEVILSNINQDTIPRQVVMQGEKDGRSLTVQVTNGGVVEPQTGLNLNLGWKHRTEKDKEGKLIQGLDAFTPINRETGLFRIEYSSSMAQPGTIDAEIQFVTSTSVTKSQPFVITVKQSTVDENAVESESSFTVLQEALTKVSQYDDKIEGLQINKADKNDVTKVEDMVSKMPTATPKETFLNLAALQAKYPNGNTSAMVVLESDGKTGYVYLWDGSAWIKGALYQAQGIAEKSIDNLKIKMSTITPDRTAFVDYAGVNVLNNDSAQNDKVWKRIYSASPTIEMQSANDMCSFDPIILEAGKQYFTTKIRTSTSYILEGSWDPSTNVYSGTYSTLQNYLQTDEFTETTIKPDKDLLLFLSISTALSDEKTAMVFEGSEKPQSFSKYNEFKGIVIKNLVIPTSRQIFVEKNGNGDYTTISEAVSNFKNGDVIYVGAGDFYEKISELEKTVVLVGSGPNLTSLYFDSNDYKAPPLEIAKGRVSNMTIYAKKNEGAEKPSIGYTPYAVHIDWLQSKNEELYFDNCLIKSDWNAACGIGLRSNFKLQFKNCRFESTDNTNTNGAVFFHDSNNASAYGRGNIEFVDCDMYSTSAIAIMPSSSGIITENNSVYMRFIRTGIYSEINGKENGAVGVGRPIIGDGWRQYNNFYLTEDSWGNNNPLFNN